MESFKIVKILELFILILLTAVLKILQYFVQL